MADEFWFLCGNCNKWNGPYGNAIPEGKQTMKAPGEVSYKCTFCDKSTRYMINYAGIK